MISAFDSFIKASSTNSPELEKVTLFSTMPMDEKQAVKSEIGKVFDFCTDPEIFLNDRLLTASQPLLLWDRSSLLEKYGIAEAVNTDLCNYPVYNNPAGIIVSKLDTLKLLVKTRCPHIPKTVFDVKDAEKLQFPIIAKASNTYQSRGVEKVKNKTELKKLSPGFDIYQEQIQIEEEFRAVFFKGKGGMITLIAVFRRDPQNAKAKDLRTNEAAGDGMKRERLESREKSDFAWTQIDPRKYPHFDIKESYNIASHVFALNPGLNVGGLDIATDKQGKSWLIESNSTPGLFSNMVPLLYKFIYEDAIGKLSMYAIKRLQEMSFYFAQLTLKDEPEFKVADNNILYNLGGYPYESC